MTIFTEKEIKKFKEINDREAWILMETLLREFKDLLIRRRDGKQNEQ